MLATAHVLRLENIAHYHQMGGRHPSPQLIRPGQEVIELVTGGRGWVEHQGAWIEVTPGALVWQIAGDRTIARSDFADPYRCLAVRVAVEPSPQRRVPRLTRWDDLEEVRTFTRGAMRWGQDDGVEREAVLAWVYGRLLFQARLSARRERGGPLPAPVARVIEALDTRYAEDLRLAQLARVIGWSATHLHAMFRRHLETSPHQYLLSRRLRAARELLATTRQPIGDVAAACGFSTAAAFCRTFRAALGTTPTAYRDRHS